MKITNKIIPIVNIISCTYSLFHYFTLPYHSSTDNFISLIFPIVIISAILEIMKPNKYTYAVQITFFAFICFGIVVGLLVAIYNPQVG